MAQVSLQYAVGAKLVEPFDSGARVVGYEVIADVDSTETPFSADYTIGANDQALAFLVLTPATAGTLTVKLYHGTTHASQIDTAALIHAGHAGLKVPAASVVLDMAVPEHRKALLIVNPGGRQTSSGVTVAWAGTTNKFSLGFTASGSYSDNTDVVVVCLGAAKRHVPGPGPV
jgi:hypothetical protein